MIGAIAGDMIGSPYERYPIKHKNFDLLVERGQVESAGKSRQRVGGESPPHGTD